MNIRTMSRHFAATLLAAALVACGGGGSDEPETLANGGPHALAQAATKNSVTLQSDAGDYIGDGKSYSYTQTNAWFKLSADGGHAFFLVNGDENWRFDFQMPKAAARLKKGIYEGAQRYSFNGSNPGLDVGGNGRGCNESTGAFTINSVAYEKDRVTALDLSFEQHCEGGKAAFRGRIRWNEQDKTVPPGPVNPPPQLWSPSAGTTPSHGNYAYFNSESDDYVGQGRTYLRTPLDSLISVEATPEGGVSVRVLGDESWSGTLQPMYTLSKLQPGYYPQVIRAPYHNPTRGGLDWNGPGGGCNRLNGWFVIDSITYENDAISALDVRFEQHCEGAKPALRGKLHWTVADTTTPPGPVFPPPSNLWEPSAGATPRNGNYVYLASEAGEYVGQGKVWVHTPLDSTIVVNSRDKYLSMTISGNAFWSGTFSAMESLAQLQPGYYAEVRANIFQNPTKGSLDWSGPGGSCGRVSGWFVVDAVTYEDNVISAIDVRFEQRCQGATPALRGKIHWRADDKTAPPGPINLPPDGLWKPQPGSTPKSGNYIYLNSEVGEPILEGKALTLTPANSRISVDPGSRGVSVRVVGDTFWNGGFWVMNSLTRIEPGYYSELSAGNPVRGGMSWTGDGRGCTLERGWFAVDKIVYSGSEVTAIDLRFGQRCEGTKVALHGQIHWSVTDSTVPPGPINPPPEDLWRPAAGATPGTGNYVYLVSDSGDSVGNGQTMTYTPANVQITADGRSGGVSIGVVSGDNPMWSGSFSAMSSLDQLQPGYYGNLQRDPFRNPALGGIEWTGMGHSCNTIAGWFVVDKVVYMADLLSAIDLRFEQHCEGGEPALRGQVHWTNVGASVH